MRENVFFLYLLLSMIAVAAITALCVNELYKLHGVFLWANGVFHLIKVTVCIHGGISTYINTSSRSKRYQFMLICRSTRTQQKSETNSLQIFIFEEKSEVK